MAAEKRKLLAALCVILLAAALWAYLSYNSEMNHMYTESSHEDVIALGIADSKIGNVRLLSAYYDRETAQYQFRMRITGQDEFVFDNHPVMEIDEQTVENYSLVYSTTLVGVDYVVIFDGELADQVLLHIGGNTFEISV